MASAGERYIFWQEKINLDIEHMALEADQRTYVLEIFQELEPEHFRNGYNPSEELTNWIMEWLGRSESYNLSKTQMGQFVFSLSPAPLGPSLGLSYVDKCNCSKRSDWCDFLNGGPSSGCVAFCEEKSSRGCGTLLLYECDKDCEF